MKSSQIDGWNAMGQFHSSAIKNIVYQEKPITSRNTCEANYCACAAISLSEMYSCFRNSITMLHQYKHHFYKNHHFNPLFNTE